MNSRSKWVTDTRESTHRALAREHVASAAGLEGNLDVSDYFTGLGFVGVRSTREIASALRWLEQRGWARRTGYRDELYGGDFFELTSEGRDNIPIK